MILFNTGPCSLEVMFSRNRLWNQKFRDDTLFHRMVQTFENEKEEEYIHRIMYIVVLSTPEYYERLRAFNSTIPKEPK